MALLIPPSEERLLFLAEPRLAGFLKVQALEVLSSAFDMAGGVVYLELRIRKVPPGNEHEYPSENGEKQKKLCNNVSNGMQLTCNASPHHC